MASTDEPSDASAQSLRSAASGQNGCDPLAPQSTPLPIGQVLGEGTDAQGTTYLADYTDGTYRVFVSQGDLLLRKLLIGFDTNDPMRMNGETALSFQDDSGPRQLSIHLLDGIGKIMLIGPANGPLFAPDSGLETALTVGDGDVSRFTLRELPDKLKLRAVADVKDGHVLVVARSVDAYDFTEFRVFFGTGSTLEEYRVGAVDVDPRGQTDVSFDIGTETYTAYLTDLTMPDAGLVPGEGYVDETSTTTAPFTERALTGDPLFGLTFTCL